MKRLPEPELMDDVLQAQAYAAADFSATDQAVVDRIEALFAGVLDAPGRRPRIVDLGCGPGNITFRLARRWPQAEVLGIEGAGAMLAIAEERRRADPLLAARVRLVQAVLPCPGLEAVVAAAVVSNSLLHHLHDPEVLWACIRQLAAAGAVVYIKDLRRPPSAEVMNTLVERYAGDAEELLRRDYTRSLQAAYTSAEVGSQLEAAGLQGLQVNELEDRYLEIFGRLD